MIIRAETNDDRDRVYAVNSEAFETNIEADLVDALRKKASPFVSLVAEEEAEILGHIMFSPVEVSGQPDLLAMGLGPMAVTPARQRSGIGSALVREGLDRCVALGIQVVAVLGHPEYYPRFGFVSAAGFGLSSEYDVPDDVFMAMELEKGSLRGKPGTARYHPVFGEF